MSGHLLRDDLLAPVVSITNLGSSNSQVRLLVPRASAAVGTRVFTVDGAAIFEGRVITAEQRLSTLIPFISSLDSIDALGSKWSEKSRNSNALFLIDTEKKEAVVAPDPLGAAIVFYFKTDSQIHISTDVNSLNKILRENSVHTTKSIEFQAERHLISSLGSFESSYHEIKSLESFEYISFAGDSISIKNIQNKLLGSRDSYISLFQSTQTDIVENVVAASETDYSTKISHITGGFDSRLVLGTAIFAGVTDRFKYFCSGPEKTVDRIVADGLTQAFNLRRTNAAGLAQGPTSSITERLLGPLFHSDGILTTGPNGRELPVDTIAVGGGYGELYRTVYGDRFRKERAAHGSLMQDLLPWTKQEASLVTPTGWNTLSESLQMKFKTVTSNYSDIDVFGDAMWIHRRARFHFGQGSMAWSRVGARVDPLYSVNGYKLALLTPLDGRQHNILGFDLLEGFCSDLTRFEFDSPRFHSEGFRRFRRAPTERALPKWSTQHFEKIPNNQFDDKPILPSTLEQFILNERPHDSNERKKHVEKANSLGVNYWQVASYTDGQNLLRRILEQQLDSNLTSFLNVDYFQTLTTDVKQTRARIRDLYSAISLLSWQLN